MLTILTTIQSALAEAFAALSPFSMSPTSPVPSSPPPSDQPRPLLPCIRFLNAHFQHDGMDKGSYDLLYRMIEVMSAAGYEAGVIFSSQSTSPRSEIAIHGYLRCIREGTEAFRATILQPWKKARRATKSLPELDENDDMLETKWRQWYWKLRHVAAPLLTESGHTLI